MNERENEEIKINNKGHVGKLLASSVGTTVSLITIPFLPAIGIPSFIYSATKLYKHIKGDYIDNSIFSVSTNKSENTATISQSLFNPMQIFNAMTAGDTEFFLQTQALNTFVNMDKTNKKGEPITYSATTNRHTIALLTQMQRNGYVNGLVKQEKQNRKLSDSLNEVDKKAMIYDVSFQRTDKDITIDDASRMFGNLDEKIIEGLYVPTFDKSGKLTGIELNTINSITANISRAKEAAKIKLLPAPKKEQQDKQNIQLNDEPVKVTSFRESVAVQKVDLVPEQIQQDSSKISEKQNDER